MGKVVNLNYIPTEKQALAHADTHRELGYGGGLCGGKSKFLVVEAFVSCVEFPGNRWFLGRKVGRHFRQTTLETWKDTIPSEAYVINEQRGEIRIKTGGEASFIHYGGLNTREEIDKFKSAEYGGAGIDQAEECEENDFLMILPRLRLRLPNNTFPRYRFIATANPANCYFKRRYITETHKDRTFIQALLKDNPYAPPDYRDQLKSIYQHRPELLAALLDGSWDIVEGNNVVIKNVWVDFAARGRCNVIYRGKKGVSVDPARFGDDESVIYGWDGAEIIESDIYGQKDTNETASRALIMCRRIGGTFIVIDGSGVGGGVVDALTHMCLPGSGNTDIEIIEFNGASKADDNKKYYNKRAEAYWEAGRLFSDNRVSIPEDNILMSQLTGTNYLISNGRILMDDKEEIKKRIGRSPDRSDAVVMGLYALSRHTRESISDRSETSSEKCIREYNEKHGRSSGSYQAPED